MSSTSDVQMVTRPEYCTAVAPSMASIAYLSPCSPAPRRRAAADWATAC
jgi:hypothetical protein